MQGSPRPLTPAETRMKMTLMTFALLGAVTAAHAQEQKPPSVICTDGVCSEPEPAKKQEAPAEYENLKFGIYGIADIALLYRDNVLVDLFLAADWGFGRARHGQIQCGPL